MLAVCAGFAEDHGAGHIVDGLAEAVDGFAVGFHIKLLQVGGEAAQGLGVRQNSRASIAFHAALISADQGVEQSRVLADIGVQGGLVRLMGTVQDAGKDLRTEGQGEDDTADTGGRGITSADIIIHEEGFQILRAGGQRGSLAGDGEHMSGGIHTGIAQSVADEGLIGQGLQCRAGLGDDDEQGVGDIDRFQDSGCIVRIHVADEARFHFQGVVLLCPVLQSDVEGAGTQIASADTDLHDGGEFLARRIGDLAGMYLVCELGGLLLLAIIEFALVDAVGDDVFAQLAAAELVEDQTLLTGVDHSAVQELFIFFDQLLLFCQLGENGERIVVNRLCGEIIFHSAGHGDTVFCHALRGFFTGHRLNEVYLALQCHKFFINSQCVEIFPGNHFKDPP